MKTCKDIVPFLGPLHDGELEGNALRSVEEHVAQCAACTARKALLAARAETLREVLAERADGTDYDALADGVMARIRREQPLPAKERRRVWGRELWGAHRKAFTAIGGLAVAASLAGIFALSPATARQEEPVLLASAQIDELDFGSHDGAVLELPHDTTVIWLSEEK